MAKTDVLYFYEQSQFILPLYRRPRKAANGPSLYNTGQQFDAKRGDDGPIETFHLF